jgi:hypothetical protein
LGRRPQPAHDLERLAQARLAGLSFAHVREQLGRIVLAELTARRVDDSLGLG